MWCALGILALFSRQNFAEPLKASLLSEAGILINADTGRVLFEKNANQELFPASITKVATALYILENFGHRIKEETCAKATALGWGPVHLKRTQSSRYPSYLLESGATHMGVRVGEKISVEGLLYGLLIGSAGDAANVLAEHFGGSIPEFMQSVNVYLRAKGLTSTYFNNPHGLHHADHHTTVRDMAIVAREAMKFPLFRTIVRQEKGLRPQTNLQPPSTYGQSNLLLKPGRFHYPYATGIKTGYMSKAKFTLIASADKDDRHVIAVIMGSQLSEHRYIDVINLFEAAFNEKKASRLLLTKEYDTFSLVVKGSASALKAHMLKDLILEYYPSEEPQVHTAIEWKVHHLPIKKGEGVGYINLFDQNNALIQKELLIATEDVNPTLYWKMRHYIGVIASMKLTKVIVLLMLIVSITAGWLYFKREPAK